MLVASLLTASFFVTGQCQITLTSPYQEGHSKLNKCIIDILDKYFFEQKQLTYVNINSDDETLLKVIHATMNISLICRKPTHQMFTPNKGYLIYSADVTNFVEYFEYLIREPTWNPHARFLIIVTSIQDFQLKLIFDELLKLHVNNVLVMNATDGGQLYTYNPFDNYACGRNYNTVINYGLCSQTTNNLYPNKLVTGLKKCNFIASAPHRPPFILNPLKTEENRDLLGIEEYVLTSLGKKEQFTVNFIFNYDIDSYSSVEPNMTAIGSMAMLQKNQVDIIFGGLVLVTSRAEGFTYLCGYHDYGDELRFAVKRSSLIPTWRYIYLIFQLEVWVLLLIVFIIFSIIAITLLQSNDRGEIILGLLDNLLLHGSDVPTRFTVKCVFILWVWFAYLINTFYQSSLFSFTTHPSTEYQISEEDEIYKYGLKPCFSKSLRKYLYTETTVSNKTIDLMNEGCRTTPEAMDTVSKTKGTYTLLPNYIYLYNERKYNDKWGDPLIYYFHKPYTKFLFAYFFYKGFPITKRLQLNAMRMKESGLVDKKLRDHYYARKLKQRFSQKTFETRFLYPWCVCVPGVIIATVVFIMELIKQHKN